MAGIQKALAFVKDPQSTRLGLTFSGKSVGNGEHVPRAGMEIEMQFKWSAEVLKLFQTHK